MQTCRFILKTYCPKKKKKEFTLSTKLISVHQLLKLPQQQPNLESQTVSLLLTVEIGKQAQEQK